jgi:hypothetical protein
LKSEESKENEGIKPDKLLWFLLNSKLPTQRNSSDLNIAFPELYKKLIEVLIPENKEESIVLIKDYLNEWYDTNKGSPWHDTHKRQWGYSGYWSWESAAVVKVMGLDDSSFKDHPHYPYDIVHWQDDIQE